MGWQVTAAAVKRGKIRKTIASAGAKGVSRVNAIIQRTSKAVKVTRLMKSFMRDIMMAAIRAIL